MADSVWRPASRRSSPRPASRGKAFACSPGALPKRRQVNYLSRLLTEDTAAKEIKLFNLGEHLVQSLHDTVRQVLRGRQIAGASGAHCAGFGLGLVATLGFYGSYAWIVWHTVQDKISLGDMTLYLSDFSPGAIDVSIDSLGRRQYL